MAPNGFCELSLHERDRPGLKTMLVSPVLFDEHLGGEHPICFSAFQSCVLFTENASAETLCSTPHRLLFGWDDFSDRHCAHECDAGGVQRFWNHMPGDCYRLTGHF